MAYYAIRCVSGRELLVKNYIQRAILNHRRTDVLNIVVPSQTVINLNDPERKQTQFDIISGYRSYIFVNVESDNKGYEEMPGDLYHLLRSIPNVIQVLTTNVDHDEACLLDELESTLVSFTINNKVGNAEKKDTASIVTKVIEFIKQRKTISLFKRFVNKISQSNKGLQYSESNGAITILAPFGLIMRALDQIDLTMNDLLNSPIRLVDALIGVST